MHDNDVPGSKANCFIDLGQITLHETNSDRLIWESEDIVLKPPLSRCNQHLAATLAGCLTLVSTLVEGKHSCSSATWQIKAFPALPFIGSENWWVLTLSSKVESTCFRFHYSMSTFISIFGIHCVSKQVMSLFISLHTNFHLHAMLTKVT